MEENKYKSTYLFTVEPFTEDFSGQLSWGQLGNLLLRSAQWHSDSRNFGFGRMSSSNLAWVLSRLTIEMYRRPHTGETFQITTWASSLFRQFTTRLFTISSKDGEFLGKAHSVWALIDLNTRQPADLSAISNGGLSDYILPTPDFGLEGCGRIRVSAEEAETTRRVGFTDLDINGHLNSIRSMEMVIDLFTNDLCDKLSGENCRMLRRIDMAYAHEAFGGEELQFFVDRKSEEEGLCQVEVRKGGKEVVLKAQVLTSTLHSE